MTGERVVRTSGEPGAAREGVPLRSRLALRIYLVGLAQFAAVIFGFWLIVMLNRPLGGGPVEGHARFVAQAAQRALADPAAAAEVLQQARRDLHASTTLVAPDGSTVASTAPPAAPRCRVGEPPDRQPGYLCFALPLDFPDGRRGHLEYLAVHRPPPMPGWHVVAIVLVVVGVSSWLLARTLTRPLRRLSDAARALGGGQLAARAALDRRDELGEVSRAFDEMADRVTQLLRAEKELLANVSHELRTPLARIRVALDLAAEGDATMAQESLAEIASDLDELERLIADVLTAARLDLADADTGTGIPPLRRERVELRELVERAASKFRGAHPERTLHVQTEEALPTLDGDPVLLRRVIDNLLENAHKYTERADAPITLTARGGDLATVEVIDRGIGIEASDLARVFRPFFRADRSRTRATGGLGLGLALARRIVEAHGGRIALHSQPGEGTRATVELPVSAPSSA